MFFFKKIIYIIIILILISSCRKDKEFILNEKKVITQEEINSLKNIERGLLIWRNKKNFNTLKKYLNAIENNIKFSKNELKNRIFLSEYYFYLSFMTKNKEKKLYALNKAYKNSRKGLEISSPKYKEELDKNIQDYKIITLVDPKYSKLLYWYINDSIFLRKEENNIILFKDDLEESLKYYHKITNTQEKIFFEFVFLYHIPKIANGDKEQAIKGFENLKDKDILSTFIKKIYISKYKKTDFKMAFKSLNSDDFKEQIFIKMIEVQSKIKK